MRGKGKNPQWVYKDGDHKHAHYWHECNYCGDWHLARVDGNGKYCSPRCSGKATNPCERFSDREGYLVCAKCGVEKHEDEFDLWTGGVTGRKPRCKTCRAKDWQEAKTPELLASMAEYSRQYLIDNREKEYARQRRWRQENPDKSRATDKRWRDANSEKVKMREHKRRAQKLATQVADIPDELLFAKWEFWGWRCWMCGSPEVEHIDHVKPLSKGGYHMLSNLRPSCAHCNRRKHNAWPFPTAAFCDPFGVSAN